MRRRVVALLALASVMAGLSPAVARADDATDLAQYVDPLIGTYPPGFVNPGPVLPHGLVGLGPDTEGPLNYGGYHYVNNTIVGFSHIHMSAGVPRGGQIPVMPVVGPVDLEDGASQIPEMSPVPNYASPFSHAAEVAEAGYYNVTLSRYATTAELTATERAGMHRYTFPAGQPASIVFDVSRDLQGYHDAVVKLEQDGSVTGHVVAERGIKVYFAATFSEEPVSAQTFSGTTPSAATEAAGTRAGAIVGFGSDGGQVSMKVGISFVDVDGARRNLDTEIPGWDFDAVRAAARDRWNTALGKIEIEGGTDAERTSFYTALYHAQFFPNIFSDVDGRYIGFDDVIRTSDRTHYTQFSLWDSYRGQNQLLSVISPNAYDDMISSLLDMYRQGGKLPRWTFANRDPAHMSGDPVIPFIGEGWCRGVLDDWSATDRSDLFTAMRERTIDNRPADYDALGFSPVDKPGNWFNALSGGDSRTGTTLEYGIAEFALALMAESDSNTSERDLLVQRASYFRNLLDPETKWIRPRHADGTWLTEFIPENGYGFQEGTSWQYSWLAMQDLRGLFDLMGGDAAVQQRLDQFFNLPATGTVPVVWPKVQNQATIFGIDYHGNQNAPGNEHDLQAPFLYNYAGAPWKTQAVARGVASLFTPTPDGLPGNDDLGALSGWLVWTMLGVYPMTPGAPLYTVASPIFERAVVHRPGSDLIIDAPGASPVSKFVQSATLDGSPLEKTWFTTTQGNELSLQMGPVPSTSWGTGASAAPPSASHDPVDAFGCIHDDEQPVATVLTYIGDTQGRGATVRLAASLTDASGTPLAAKTITFTIAGQLLSATTGPDGVAETTAVVEDHGRSQPVTAEFAGDGSYQPSSVEATIVWGRSI